MANPNEEEQAANDRLIAVAVKWFCAHYVNGVLKKRAESDLMNATIVAMSERMARARETGEDLPWVEDLRKVAGVSEKMRDRVGAVLRKHRQNLDSRFRGNDSLCVSHYRTLASGTRMNHHSSAANPRIFERTPTSSRKLSAANRSKTGRAAQTIKWRTRRKPPGGK